MKPPAVERQAELANRLIRTEFARRHAAGVEDTREPVGHVVSYDQNGVHVRPVYGEEFYIAPAPWWSVRRWNEQWTRLIERWKR